MVWVDTLLFFTGWADRYGRLGVDILLKMRLIEDLTLLGTGQSWRTFFFFCVEVKQSEFLKFNTVLSSGLR